jgi:hypothetical protein
MIPASRKSRNGKRLAAVFAAALVMGLSAASVLAQGGYYPVSPAGPGNPPTGTPIVTAIAPELNLLETKLNAVSATLIVPPPAGKTAATPAQITTAANQAALTVIAGGAPGVTLGSLAAQVVNYLPTTSAGSLSLRQAAVGQIATAIMSASGAKVADLTAVANAVAAAAPDSTSLHAFLPSVYTAAAGDAVVAASVKDIAAAAIVSAASVPAAALPTALDASGVTSIVADALNAISLSGVLTPANKTTYIKNVVTSSIQSAPVAGSYALIDAAAAAATSINILPYYTGPAANWLTDAVTNAKNAVLAPTDEKLGAVAQGALRAVTTLADVGKVKLAISNPYTDALADAYWAARNATVAAAPGAVVAAGAVTDPHIAAALVAGGNVSKGGVAGAQILKAVLDATVALAPGETQAIVAAAVGSAQQYAATIAGGAVATVNGSVTLKDIAQGGVFGAKVASAGSVAYTILQQAGAPSSVKSKAIVDGAIRGSVSVGAPQDAIADIVYQSAFFLRLEALASTVPADMADQAVKTVASLFGSSGPTYIAAVAALAGDVPGYHRASILASALAADAGDDNSAISAGATLVQQIQTSTVDIYKNTLAAFTGAATKNQALATLYAAELANQNGAVASLAAAIKYFNYGGILPGDVADFTAAAISSNRSQQTSLTIARDVAVHMTANPNDILDFVGKQIVANPAAGYVNAVATAAVVVVPEHSNYIAHAVAYNAPVNAYNAVSSIFQYSKINLLNGGSAFVKDRPAAAAAISAGLTTGILENTQLSVTDKKTALTNAINVAVLAALGYQNMNAAGTAPANNLLQYTVSNPLGVLQSSRGAAGAVAGFVAQMVKPADVALDADGITAAVLTAAGYSGRLFMLEIAQAAGQAAGWISGNLGGNTAVAALAIRTGMATALSLSGSTYTLAQIQGAVDFGFDQGKAGVPGAGAAGLRKDGTAPFYDHHSATGEPVSNMFSL